MGKKTNEIRHRIQSEKDRRAKKGLSNELTKEDIDRIVKQVNREYKLKKIYRGMLLALGIGVGAGGIKLLNEAKYSEIKTNNTNIEIDIQENNKDSEINNVIDDKEMFINGLKVTVNDVNQIAEQNKKEDELVRKITLEINGLKSKQEVLDYIKQYYVNEYNKQHEEKIESENVDFYKARDTIRTYEDQANNGEKILRCRYLSDKNGQVETSSGVIRVRIDGNDIEYFAKYKDKYVKVYNYDENVEEYKDNIILTKVAGIIDTGIDMANSIEQQETDFTVKEEYKRRLINELKSYEMNKQIEDDGYEIDK